MIQNMIQICFWSMSFHEQLFSSIFNLKKNILLLNVFSSVKYDLCK